METTYNSYNIPGRGSRSVSHGLLADDIRDVRQTSIGGRIRQESARSAILDFKRTLSAQSGGLQDPLLLLYVGGSKGLNRSEVVAGAIRQINSPPLKIKDLNGRSRKS